MTYANKGEISMNNRYELYHHGILGQKWGVRRYQNSDGTLTNEGKIRYAQQIQKEAHKDAQRWSDAKAAYGEGAGTRRKLLEKELSIKRRDKDYAKAYSEAEKYVDVEKSMKRAEALNRHSGAFSRGHYLADKGRTSITALLNGMSGGLMAFGAYSNRQANGADLVTKALYGVAGATAVVSLYKGTKDAYSVHYYEKNKRF